MIPDCQPRFTFDIIIRLSSGIRDAGLKRYTRARLDRPTRGGSAFASTPRRRYVRGRFRSSSSETVPRAALGKRNPYRGRVKEAEGDFKSQLPLHALYGRLGFSDRKIQFRRNDSSMDARKPLYRPFFFIVGATSRARMLYALLRTREDARSLSLPRVRENARQAFISAESRGGGYSRGQTNAKRGARRIREPRNAAESDNG